MSAVGGRDAGVIRRGIERWLVARAGGTANVVELTRPSAGYSGETNLVEIDHIVDGAARRRSIVVRLAPDGPGAHPSFDLATQAAAQEVAAAVGVPIAGPLELELDPAWLGSPFLVMARVDGHIAGDVVGHDRWVRSLGEDGQRRLYERFVDLVATLHRADPETATTRGVPRYDVDAELARWHQYLLWSSGGEPLPVLVAALEHCRATAPAGESEPVLLWGDVRLGNVVWADDLEPLAVLDWDMTSVGAAEHDIAWLTSLDTTMRRLMGTRAPGLLDRDGVLARYEATSGRRLRDIEWFETFAMVRTTAIMTRIGSLQAAAGVETPFPVADNPILELLADRL